MVVGAPGDQPEPPLGQLGGKGSCISHNLMSVGLELIRGCLVQRDSDRRRCLIVRTTLQPGKNGTIELFRILAL